MKACFLCGHASLTFKYVCPVLHGNCGNKVSHVKLAPMFPYNNLVHTHALGKEASLTSFSIMHAKYKMYILHCTMMFQWGYNSCEVKQIIFLIFAVLTKPYIYICIGLMKNIYENVRIHPIV